MEGESAGAGRPGGAGGGKWSGRRRKYERCSALIELVTTQCVTTSGGLLSGRRVGRELSVCCGMPLGRGCGGPKAEEDHKQCSIMVVWRLLGMHFTALPRAEGNVL